MYASIRPPKRKVEARGVRERPRQARGGVLAVIRVFLSVGRVVLTAKQWTRLEWTS